MRRALVVAEESGGLLGLAADNWLRAAGICAAAAVICFIIGVPTSGPAKRRSRGQIRWNWVAAAFLLLAAASITLSMFA